MARASILDHTLWGGKLFDGRWRPTSSTLQVKEPATGEILGEVGRSLPAEIEALVARALEAQVGWALWTAEARAGLLRRTAQVLEDNRTSLIEMIIRETGGLRGKAEFELNGTISELIHSAAILVAPEGHVL